MANKGTTKDLGAKDLGAHACRAQIMRKTAERWFSLSLAPGTEAGASDHTFNIQF